MKMTYDNKTDALHIKLTEKSIVESEEIANNIVVDFDEEKNIVGFEMLYFVEKHREGFFSTFKEIEKAVWSQNSL